MTWEMTQNKRRSSKRCCSNKWNWLMLRTSNISTTSTCLMVLLETTTRKVATTAKVPAVAVVADIIQEANSRNRELRKVLTMINSMINITSKRRTTMATSKTKTTKTWSQWSSNRIKFNMQIKINESAGDQLLLVDSLSPFGIINNWTAPWLGSRILTPQLSMVSV